MVGNLRVPSITAVSFVVCRESFIGYSFARSRRGGGGGGSHLVFAATAFFQATGKVTFSTYSCFMYPLFTLK
ncbi:Uncharacterised protein [Salmonella enterica subsp. enterica serovar Typhi]|nr:Uncharacterised protein [Salmonella enterica subsp. enterica serovar Typhi]CER89101.1 Uncharacterised protein [Salmonella enterica subsp. enterica serovar Typhi]CET09716.1 Uncharacterised protein [Salmonella enterica subsp. enterica serovar Typhi]CEU26375.1 Uncharacterised protein [Salmonella enterica subsp. enterica serovar Typhi]CEU41582.1 Uncharacterised protein [Salmonella enterica subsp. enterica serovar Typhi]